jgi:parallel beta-helix repeat protein
MATSVLLKGSTVCIILSFLLGSIIPSAAHENKQSSLPFSNGVWLYVGGSGPNNFTKIQDAVDNASDGDTVFVYKGTYVGYVVIHKSIRLLGEDKNTTIISGFFAYTVYILSDWVNVSGFTIFTNGRLGEGIRIDSCHNHFTNNIIDAPRDRIRVAGSSNTVSYNLIKNCYLFVSGNSNMFFGNTIINTYFGISLTGYATDNIITNNSLFSCGLFISDNTVGENSVTGNTVNGKPLMYLDDDSNTVLHGDAGQIVLFRCTNITVHNQMIVNTTVGIQLWESTACVVTGNTLAGNHYGIYLYGWNNTIDGNTIADGYYGVFLSGDNNSVSANTFARNNGTSLYLQHSKHNVIVRNTVTQDNYGILLDYGSVFNTVLDNSIANNSHAILGLSGTSEAMIAGNTIINNHGDGIDLSSSDRNTISGNTISHNNGDGIDLSDCHHNIIINTAIANNSDEGIHLEFSEDNQIINATIVHNHGDGVFIHDSTFNSVSKCTITHNDEDGIRLEGDKNTISGNTITHNDHGIAVYGHEYNMMTSNSIAWNNGSGIYLDYSNSNMLSGNTFSREKRGVYLVSSINNTFLSNNFLGNRRHALFENCSNTWSRNYWGRPRILPKIILGVQSIDATKPSLLFDVDWRPALRPNDNKG